MMQGSIPVTWNIEELKTLKYEFGFFTSDPPVETYTSVGHDPYRISIYTDFLFNLNSLGSISFEDPKEAVIFELKWS